TQVDTGGHRNNPNPPGLGIVFQHPDGIFSGKNRKRQIHQDDVWLLIPRDLDRTLPVRRMEGLVTLIDAEHVIKQMPDRRVVIYNKNTSHSTSPAFQPDEKFVATNIWPDQSESY